jgi:lactoylglutathione lyase
MNTFAYTIMYVKDVPAALMFYQKAFGFKQKFLTPGNDYGELDTGSTTLSFAAISLAMSSLPEGFVESDPASKPFAMEIAIATDDVEGVFNNAIKAGAIALAEASLKPWGQTVAYVRDPNGFLIEICTPIVN